MARRTAPLLPSTAARLQQFGERLRLARQRRGLTAEQVAERAGMVSMTLRGIERGRAGATIGAYAAVMQVLGIEKDLNLLAATDPTGRALQDAHLSERSPRSAPRATAGRVRSATGRRVPATTPASAAPTGTLPRATASTSIEKQGFTSAASLARLLAPGPPRSKAKKR